MKNSPLKIANHLYVLKFDRDLYNGLVVYIFVQILASVKLALENYQSFTKSDINSHDEYNLNIYMKLTAYHNYGQDDIPKSISLNEYFKIVNKVIKFTDNNR